MALDPPPPLAHRFATARAESLTLDGRLLHATLLDRMFGAPPPTVTIGRFEVRELLGEGGMGKVYLAVDPRLRRTVALKVLHPGRDRVRLAREARAMARLSHPNVVQVFDVGRDDRDDLFVAMEFVAGTTLRSWLGRPRDEATTLNLFVQAGRGLAAAHRAGVLHRDFKPANVLVATDGTAKVTDFGLAGLPIRPVAAPHGLDVHDEVTTAGTIVGTPAYMAPEQLAGERIDASADQFAFCVALFEALYAERPRPRDGRAELHAQLQRVRATLSGADEVHRFEAISRGLSWCPSARWPELGSLLARLATPVPRRRWPRWLAAAALVGAGAVLFGMDSPSARPPSSLGLAAVEANARIELADHLAAAGQTQRASVELEAAFDLASGARVDHAAARAATELIFVDGYLLASPTRGDRWGRHAAAALNRLGPSCAIESRRHRHLGILAQHRGALDEATAHFEAALRLALRAYGPGHPWLGTVHGNLGSHAYARGDYERARAHYRRSLHIFESTPHARPVELAMALDDLGSVELELGDPSAAIGRFTAAIEVRKALPAKHPHHTISWRLLGWAALEGGHHSDAQRHYQRAIRAARVAFGAEHPTTAVLIADLAEVHLDAGEFRRANELFSQALVITEAVLGPDHQQSKRCRTGAEAARQRGRRRSPPHSASAI